jgi:hypothetical protein
MGKAYSLLKIGAPENLQVFIISWSVFPWQAFLAESNVRG